MRRYAMRTEDLAVGDTVPGIGTVTRVELAPSGRRVYTSTGSVVLRSNQTWQGVTRPALGRQAWDDAQA